MIAIELEGRLGNQLFQYAFIYSEAKSSKQNFYLDRSIEPLLIDKYFKVPNDKFYKINKYVFSIRGYKNLFSFHLKRIFYTLLKHIFSLNVVSVENPEQISRNFKKNVLYKGYFQSQLYFKSYTEEIKGLFLLKEKLVDNFLNIKHKLPTNLKYVTIHIRRTDYINSGFELPVDYYYKAIEKFCSEKYYYIFISDDPSYVEKNFSHITNKFISRNSEIIDFQFLMDADVCILSNSSFSWWGAYLNCKNPQIITPKYWMGFNEGREIPKDIIPPNWITLEF